MSVVDTIRAARTFTLEYRGMGFNLLCPSQYEAHLRFSTRTDKERELITSHRADALSALIGWDSRVTYPKFFGKRAAEDPIPFSTESATEVLDADLNLVIAIVEAIYTHVREVRDSLQADEKN